MVLCEADYVAATPRTYGGRLMVASGLNFQVRDKRRAVKTDALVETHIVI